MFDNMFRGSKKFWAFVGFLGLLIAVGGYAYGLQLTKGLTVTGMNRDVSWGFYISQFTFLVGVAASAVMMVIPYYLHQHKVFSKTVILGEFLAVAAVLMCMLFIFADMGQPARVTNVILFPTFNSVMFWDMSVLSGYLVLNLVIGFVTLEADRRQAPPPAWVKPLIYLSVPWAVSIHTVTAFLYSGLEARPFWLTAVLAPRFLASAFASGPSLLIILCLIVKRFSKFDPGKEAIQTLTTIVTYALCLNLFFVGVEVFTVYYSNLPHHLHHFQYLFFGLEGKGKLVPWIWTGQTLAICATILMLFPSIRRQEKLLPFICAGIITAIWIEKGMGMVITGFVPSPLGHVTEYMPTRTELAVAFGIYGIGFLVLTMLYKIIIGVREKTGEPAH